MGQVHTPSTVTAKKMPQNWQNYLQSYIQDSQLCHNLNPSFPHYLTIASHLHKPSGYNYITRGIFKTEVHRFSTNLEATSKF